MPKVVITTEDGSTITIEVELASDTVAVLKGKVEDKEGIRAERQQLTYEGSILEDDSTLQACGIVADAALQLRITEEVVRVHIQQLAAVPFTITARPAETLADLKHKIEEQGDFPFSQQRLSLNGRRLNDENQLLSDLCTQDGVTLELELRIHLTIRLYTGMVFPLEVAPNERVDALQSAIFRRGEIPYHLQEITYDDQVLENGLRINDYHVPDRAHLYVARRHYEVMVFIKTLTGQTIMIRVAPADTVAQVKAKIESQENIPISRQRLVFMGEQLSDFRRLLDYRIEHESAVHLVLRTGNGFQIYVRVPSGRMLVFEVQPGDLIDSVKTKIRDREGIPLDLQQLMLNGQEIPDDVTFQDRNVAPDTIFDLVIDHNRNTQIFISLPSNNTITLWVNPDETVATLKESIEKRENIAANLQDLFFTRQKLENDHTLRSYWIEENHMLHLEIYTPPVLCFKIRLQTGRVLRFEEPENQTVEGVRNEIERREGIPVGEQQLFFGGRELVDGDRKLKDYEIKDRSVLDLITSSDADLFEEPTGILLFVKTLSGRTVTLTVHPNDKIRDLKQQILSKEGIPLSHQCLVAAGKHLDNDLDVSSCKIQNHSVLHLVLRLPSQGPIQLSISTQNGLSFQVDGNLADTIATLKARIHEVAGIPLEQQLNLMFEDRALDDSESTLGSYSIMDGATLHLSNIDGATLHLSNT